jgi:YVTN family beta-propeller protein
MCVLLVACCANAQSLGPNTLYRKSLGKGPEITVGGNPVDIQINRETNKIYVANELSNSISMIDSESGNSKSIRVGSNPEPEQRYDWQLPG